MDQFPTFSAVIDALGGSASFGEIIGKPIGTASAMKTRDVIPPAHWNAVVRGAALHGINGVTYELLSMLYAQRRASDPAPSDPTPEPVRGAAA